MVQATQPQSDIINGTPKEGHGQPIWQADAEGPNFTREEFALTMALIEVYPDTMTRAPTMSPKACQSFVAWLKRVNKGTVPKVAPSPKKISGGGGQCGRITHQTGVEG